MLALLSAIKDQVGDTSYVPNLIADSGITLTTFNPLPVRISKDVGDQSVPYLPAKRLRMPPAAHSSFIAFADVMYAPRTACRGAPALTACTGFGVLST
jgi:hypothetical protein